MTGFIWLRIGSSGHGSCEHGKELSASIKYWKFLKWLGDWRFLRKNSVPYYYFLIRIVVCGVHTGSTCHVGHIWPIVPAPGDCEDGELRGMKIGMGNRRTRRKPAPVPLYPPEIPLDQTRSRSRPATVASQRLTAWAMERSFRIVS
jgi:hypothetical protein